MGLRTSLLRIVDSCRKLSGPDFADIRVNQLTVRTRTWSGDFVGNGTFTDSDLVLPARYPIRYLTVQEVFSAAGAYEVGDVIVDHITPFDGVSTGYTKEQLRPQFDVNNIEVIHFLTGSHAGDYRCIDVRTYRAFTTQLVLRRQSTTP